MKKLTALACLLLLPFVGTEASDHKPFEMPRTHVVPILDTKQDRQYELYINLPEGYVKNTEKKYPVIYMTDGGWNMLPLAGSTAYLMPDVILVGISWQKNIDRTLAFESDDEWVHASRYRDYTLAEWSNPEEQAVYQAGQASNHLSFIREGVIKYVESNYRVAPGERGFFGYSLGGSFGAYILFAEPDTFNHYILGSPALGQRSLKIVDELARKITSQNQAVRANVFVTIGELEETEMNVTEDFASLLERTSQSGVNFEGLQIIANSDHGTAVPETVMRGIKWLTQQISE